LREKILIIASWGLPPSWKSATYKLSITSEGFRRFLDGKSLDYESITCTSRYLTPALASLLSLHYYLEDIVPINNFRNAR
jgi:hypothetical protein